MKSCLFIIAFLLGSIHSAFSQSIVVSDFFTGLEAMSNVDRLPFLHAFGSTTKQFSSFDVSGKNNDGNTQKAFTKYIDEKEELVIFDETGPGCLYRQQMNVWASWDEVTIPKVEWNMARIKYYFDDEPSPRVDMSMSDFFRCKTDPFTAPLCFIDSTEISGKEVNRFAVMYFPFTFSKRLKVTISPTLDRKDFSHTWYQYTYLTYPKDKNIDSWKGVSLNSEKVRKQWQNLGKDPKDQKNNSKTIKTLKIPKGKQRTIVDLKGMGSIASIKIHLTPFTKETFYNTQIKIFWDNDPVPAVDLPLGYLFGGGGKDYECSNEVWQKTLSTLLFGFDSQKGDFYSYWPMPYWKAAKIVIENNGAEDITDFSCELETKSSEVLNYSFDSSGYFCAKRTLDSDIKGKPFANVFSETGRGHVAALTFFTEGFDMDGDEFTFMDGSRTPQIHGDGTEDDHNQGWGGEAYHQPLWGGLINGYQGAYRIYLNDNYVFNSDISINYEYSIQWSTFPDGGKTDVTIFYYKSGNNEVLQKTDQVDVGNAISENKHSYTISGNQRYEKLFSAYDGYEKNAEYDTLTDDGRSYDGFSQFTVNIDPDNSGVRLRKRLSRLGNGVQTAKVFADGAEIGTWRIVQSSYAPINQAWLDADFDIPAAYTKGKNSLTLKFEYLDSGPMKEINEFYYTIFSFLKAKK